MRQPRDLHAQRPADSAVSMVNESLIRKNKNGKICPPSCSAACLSRHRRHPGRGSSSGRYCVHTDQVHTTAPFGSDAARNNRPGNRNYDAFHHRRRLGSAHDNSSDRCSARTRHIHMGTRGDNIPEPPTGVSRPQMPMPRSISLNKTSLSLLLFAVQSAIAASIVIRAECSVND
jgi:hypothetical protein